MKRPIKPFYHSLGFTLIELMIAITLGLIISAAALRFFMTSTSNYRIQQSAEDIQEAEVFSLDYVQKEIAMANFGTNRPMKQESAWTGIVLTNEIKDGTKVVGNLRGIKNFDTAWLTKNNVGYSNLDVKSDQLVIEYIAPFKMQDCEGNLVDKDSVVIERFFTGIDPIQSGHEATDANQLAIALYCDAGSYQLPLGADPSEIKSGDIAENITNFGGPTDGSILISRIDAFKIQLGVQLKDGIAYMSVDEYLQKSGGKYKYDAPIVSIKTAVLARAISPINTQTNHNFTIFGQDVTIQNTSKNYFRRVYESTTRLRNHATSS